MPSTLASPAGRIPPAPGIPGSRAALGTVVPGVTRAGPPSSKAPVAAPARGVGSPAVPRVGGHGVPVRTSGPPDRSTLGRGLAPAPAPPTGGSMIGRVIGDRYGVTALIGEGGMGEVYEAEHLAIGRLVAVKVLNPKRAHDRDAISRLRHEARVAGTLGHPNICAIYDMGRLDDGSPYLVMERLHGETLAQRLQREKRLPIDELIEVVVQVLSALSAAHQRGIIHRDLKPDNIFLARREGLRPIPKLLDFGISKSEDLEETMADLTGKTMAAGTPFYMAPEQARGDRGLDHRIDLWASGVILYECLSGQPPFDARNYNALLVQILTASPRPLRELHPGVPAAMEEIVERALRKLPDERFQTAVEVQAALRGVKLADATTRKMPAKRRSVASDPSSDDSDATFIFSRAAIGLSDDEDEDDEPEIEPEPEAQPEPDGARLAIPPGVAAALPSRPAEVIEFEETTGVYLPYTDDEDERTMVDEPRFLRDSSATTLRRDTIPMPPRKE